MYIHNVEYRLGARLKVEVSPNYLHIRETGKALSSDPSTELYQTYWQTIGIASTAHGVNIAVL